MAHDDMLNANYIFIQQKLRWGEYKSCMIATFRFALYYNPNEGHLASLKKKTQNSLSKFYIRLITNKQFNF